MKIYFNRARRDSSWGGGAHFASAMADYLTAKGHQVVYRFEKGIDRILMLDPRPEDGGSDINQIRAFKILNPEIKVIHRINECDARKGTRDMDKMLLEANQIADKTIFISTWLRDYFSARGFAKESSVILNGCRSDFFYPIEHKKIDRPIKLVTHHWSDNWMKGFDVYNFLDEVVQKNDDVEFTYIGRYNNKYSPKKTKIVPPMFGKELGDELRKHDIYVTASRFEPCGMHHIEGAACGLPVIYHKDGGAIPEVCSKHGREFSDVNSLYDALEHVVNNYDKIRSQIDYKSLSSDFSCEQYYKIIVD